ncbi:MAG: hypothetical protein GXP37_15560, partial [Chloroflexi bacterium]|nr:hypothetical protein [Chloroflexota bacterium]
MNQRFRPHALILLLFGAFTVIATWPLLPRLATHVPGTDTWAYDEYTFIWSMWWFKHSLIDLQSSLFFSPHIFYPLGMELILYSYNLMAAIVALPLGLAFSWPVASNVILLAGTILSGYGAYLLAWWLIRTYWRGAPAGPSPSIVRSAALLAGVLYAFASSRGVYLALGHYNIQSWYYLPFFVLYLLRLQRRPTWHNVFLAGLFAALNLLVDMQYGVFMAFLAACLLLTPPLRAALFRRPVPWQRWGALLATGVVAVLLTLPYFLETVRSMLNANFLLQGWGDALKLSADLIGWFTPTALHPLMHVDWGQRLRAVQEGSAPFRDINTVFLGYLTLLLAAIGAIALWKRARGWIWAALLSAVFTLGPLLQIRGRLLFDFDGLESSVPMPFLLLHYLPFVRGNRTANRWSIPLLLALAVLVAWGATKLLAWLQRRWHFSDRALQAISVILVLGIFAEHAFMPLPLTDARIPPAIAQLAALPDGAVLQIPMGWRNSFGVLGTERTQAQYYMTAHHKPILSGNTSRNPAIKFDYFRRLPLVTAITRAEFGHEITAEMWATAQAQADDLITLWGVRYLMLLPPVPGRLPYADTWQASQQLALDLIPHSEQPLIDDGNIRIYGVEPGPPLPLHLDFGGQNTDAWRGAGWSQDEPDVGGASGIWANKQQAQLLFRSNDNSSRWLSFRAMPFDWPGAPAQKLTLSLNGKNILETEMAADWQEYEVEVQPQPGINRLLFSFDHTQSPRAVLAQAMIGQTGVQAPLNIEVHSFDQAFITLFVADGSQIPASFGRRGYNVTVLDAGSGAILDEQGFDTVANTYEVQRLVDYLNRLPPGRLVILATQAGAGDIISPELITALQRLGSGLTSPDELAGQAHALVGIVAAAAPAPDTLSGPGQGTAAEVVLPDNAFLRISGDFRR